LSVVTYKEFWPHGRTVQGMIFEMLLRDAALIESLVGRDFGQCFGSVPI
jgi:hypothetical protein